MAILSKF